jgi:hypothetical protein
MREHHHISQENKLKLTQHSTAHHTTPAHLFQIGVLDLRSLR